MGNFPQTPLNRSWNIEPVALTNVRAIPVPGISMSYASLLWNCIQKKKYDQSVKLSESADILQRVWCCRRTTNTRQVRGLLFKWLQVGIRGSWPFQHNWQLLIPNQMNRVPPMSFQGTSEWELRNPPPLLWRNCSGTQTLHRCEMTLGHQNDQAFLIHSTNCNSLYILKQTSHRELLSYGLHSELEMMIIIQPQVSLLSASTAVIILPTLFY